MFKFLCKQNQHNELGRLITSQYGVKPRMEPYSGPRGSGVLVSFQPPRRVSNRQVDRFLYTMGLAGSRSRRNKLPILKPFVSAYEVEQKLGSNARFLLPRKEGKRRQLVKHHLVYYHGGCTCCGPTPVIERLKQSY